MSGTLAPIKGSRIKSLHPLRSKHKSALTIAVALATEITKTCSPFGNSYTLGVAYKTHPFGIKFSNK